MRSLTVATIALALAVLIGCAAAVRPTSSPAPTAAAPTATPGPTASPPPTETPSAAPLAFKTVTSPLFGWSVDIPVTWRLRAATIEWPAYTYPEAGAAYTDNMEPESGAFFPVFDVSVQTLPGDQSPEQFIASITAENEVRGYQVLSEDTVVVDGVTGRIQRQTIGAEGIWEIMVVDGDSAYAIYWVDLESQMAVNDALFRRILGSLRFPD